MQSSVWNANSMWCSQTVTHLSNTHYPRLLNCGDIMLAAVVHLTWPFRLGDLCLTYAHKNKFFCAQIKLSLLLSENWNLPQYQISWNTFSWPLLVTTCRWIDRHTDGHVEANNANHNSLPWTCHKDNIKMATLGHHMKNSNIWDKSS